MGTCTCNHMEDGAPIKIMFDTFEANRNRIELNTHSPHTIYPDVSVDINRLDVNHLKIELANNLDPTQARLDVQHSASSSQQNLRDNRILNPTDRTARVNGNNQMTRSTNLSHTEKQIMNKPDAEIDITPLLKRLMSSEDKEINIVAKRLNAEAVIPATNPDKRNVLRDRRTRSLTSLEQLKAPQFEHYPVYDRNDSNRKWIYATPERNINDDCLTDNTPLSIDCTDKKLSRMNLDSPSTVTEISQDISSGANSPHNKQADQGILEIYSKLQFEKTRLQRAGFSEKLKNMQSLSYTLSKISLAKPKEWIRFPVAEFSSEEEEAIARETHKNLEVLEDELGIITMDIDKFEQKINEIRAKISQLRGESVNILIKEITGKLKDALSYLEIEENISRLENESHELEIKRRAAVVRLQNKMLGDTFGADQKKLLP